MNRIKRVAIQGIRGSFHEEAAVQYFGKGLEVVECLTFKDTFNAVNNRRADCLVMAIENSLAGAILSNYKLMTKHNLSVVGELYLNIQLYLMGLEGTTIESATTVKSHPIALGQCEDFFSLYPHLQLVESQDTARCAMLIRDRKEKGTLAVAGKRAAHMFDLNIIKERIETNKKNYTRFLVLSKDKNTTEQMDKASLWFQVAHEKGSLLKVLQVFNDYDINMTKLQSLPVIGKPEEYRFYVDIRWKSYDDCRNAIQEMSRYTKDFSVLGEYKHDKNFKKLIRSNK